MTPKQAVPPHKHTKTQDQKAPRLQHHSPPVLCSYPSAVLLLITLYICLLAPAAQATLKVWSGGGADNFWNTAANWTNNAGPGAADDLLFPSGAARLSNSNNLTAGTALGSIIFSGSNYVIDG